MTDFLRTLRLVEDLNFELPINRSEFVKLLQANVDKPSSLYGDLFSTSKNAYKGTVTYEGFDLKRKKKIFDSNFHVATAKGTFVQSGENLIINVQIKGYSPLVIMFAVFLVLFYVIFFVAGFTSFIEAKTPLWTLPFILIHASFMFGMPYFFLRRSIGVMKYNLERDLFFFIKDKMNSIRP